jgi:hypothetical protein
MAAADRHSPIAHGNCVTSLPAGRCRVDERIGRRELVAMRSPRVGVRLVQHECDQQIDLERSDLTAARINFDFLFLDPCRREAAKRLCRSFDTNSNRVVEARLGLRRDLRNSTNRAHDNPLLSLAGRRDPSRRDRAPFGARGTSAAAPWDTSRGRTTAGWRTSIMRTKRRARSADA